MTGRLSKEVEFEFVEDGGANTGFVATGAVRGVIMRHLTGGNVEAAATLIATSAPEVGDGLLEEDARDASIAVRAAMAEMFFRARDFARAGKAALIIGDPGRAAPFFERSYQFAKAAELYEKAGQHEHAAELHERDLRHDRAAALYEQVGRLDKAAEAFERAGRLLESGKLWAKLRRLDRAVEVLQKVDRNNDRYVPATVLLGRILEHAGHRDAAVVRYVDVVKSRPLDASSVEIFERLGEIYAAVGEHKAARRLLGAVVQLDPGRERAARALAGLPPVGDAAPLTSAAPPTIRTAPAVDITVTSHEAAPSGGLPPLVLPPPPGGAAVSVTAVHKNVDTLRNLPLFSELSLDELRALNAIGEARTYQPGDIVIEQDRQAEHMLVILSGKVVVSRTDGGLEAVLAELGFGAAVGEMALVDEGPTSARVRAATVVEAFRWPMERLRRHLVTDERTALRILKVMSRTLSVRLRETNRRVK